MLLVFFPLPFHFFCVPRLHALWERFEENPLPSEFTLSLVEGTEAVLRTAKWRNLASMLYCPYQPLLFTFTHLLFYSSTRLLYALRSSAKALCKGKTSKPNTLSPYLIKMLVVLLINQKDYIPANYNICWNPAG